MPYEQWNSQYACRIKHGTTACRIKHGTTACSQQLLHSRMHVLVDQACSMPLAMCNIWTLALSSVMTSWGVIWNLRLAGLFQSCLSHWARHAA